MLTHNAPDAAITRKQIIIVIDTNGTIEHHTEQQKTRTTERNLILLNRGNAAMVSLSGVLFRTFPTPNAQLSCWYYDNTINISLVTR